MTGTRFAHELEPDPDATRPMPPEVVTELQRRCAPLGMHCHWCAMILPAHAASCPVRP